MKNNEVSLQQLIETNTLKKCLKNQNINLKVMSDNNRSEIKFLVELDSVYQRNCCGQLKTVV
jgi:hypothetical protein